MVVLKRKQRGIDSAKCLCYNRGMKAWYGLVAFACGFVVAQLWKFIAGMISQRGQKRRNFKRDGGVSDALGWDALRACGEHDGAWYISWMFCGV